MQTGYPVIDTKLLSIIWGCTFSNQRTNAASSFLLSKFVMGKHWHWGRAKSVDSFDRMPAFSLRIEGRSCRASCRGVITLKTIIWFFNAACKCGRVSRITVGKRASNSQPLSLPCNSAFLLHTLNRPCLFNVYWFFCLVANHHLKYSFVKVFREHAVRFFFSSPANVWWVYIKHNLFGNTSLKDSLNKYSPS